MASPIQITKPKVLIVEGKDEVELFTHVTEILALASDIQTLEMGGIPNLRSRLVATIKATGHEIIKSIGIVRDGDNNPNGAFASVRDALSFCGLPVPNAPLESAGTDPKTTVMILPDGKQQGMLEDVCLESVQDDPAMSCVEEYFQCLTRRLSLLPKPTSKARVRAFLSSREMVEEAFFELAQNCLEKEITNDPQRASSSTVHTFLASRYKPDLQLGQASRAGYWNLEHRCFNLIKQFLRML